MRAAQPNLTHCPLSHWIAPFWKSKSRSSESKISSQATEIDIIYMSVSFHWQELIHVVAAFQGKLDNSVPNLEVKYQLQLLYYIRSEEFDGQLAGSFSWFEDLLRIQKCSISEYIKVPLKNLHYPIYLCHVYLLFILS